MEIELRQAAATEEYEYVLPVIFHVLYRVPEDDVPVGYLSSCSRTGKRVVQGWPGGYEPEIRVLATHDPNGQLLRSREFVVSFGKGC